MSKSFITPDKLIRIDSKGNVLEAAEGLRPSSEIKMHLRCYDKRDDVMSVIHAHPPGATGFAVAHKAMDMYNMIEDVAAIGAVPLTPYGTPSTTEVPDAIEPYLEEHDVMLLENHGALAVSSDVITAFYRMESLELWAKITINAVILGGSHDIDEKNIQKLIDLRSYYRITGRHPGYKMYNPDDESIGKNAIVIRADGHSTTDILDAVLSLIPLDTYTEKPVALMEVVKGDNTPTPAIWAEYDKLLNKYEPEHHDIEMTERFAFYERAKKAYLIIATGETAIYANVLLKKGVVKV